MSARAPMIRSRTFVLAVLYALILALPALAQPWRFVYMSDHRSKLGHHPGVSTQTVSRLAADILTNRIDLLLIGGDLIHGDNQPTSDLITQYETFKGCLAPLTNAGIPYYAIPGNHEFWAQDYSWSEATDAWWQALGQSMPQNGPTNPCELGMTYSFDHKNALFMGLNMFTNDTGNSNNPLGYKGVDTNWVQNQLAGNTKPHVFAFGHAPATSIAGTSTHAQNIVDFWNLLAAARCSAYFCGHIHNYQRTLTRAPNGAGYIFEVMDGSGLDEVNSASPPWWPAGNPVAVEHLSYDDTMRGYVLVDVNGLNVSVTRRCFYTNAADQVFWTNMDSFAYTADPGTNWSFAVFGDTRGNGTNWPSEPCINTPVIQAICAAITNAGALCAIVPGDLQHGQFSGVTNSIDNQLLLWTNAVSALDRAGIPYYAIRGNHETYRTAGASDPAHVDWMKQIGRYMPTNGPENETGMTYSIPWANAFFIGLDTYHGTNDNGTYHLINQDWLAAQLAANSRPHLFVFGHEPAVRAGISCLSENLPQRNRFWDSIGSANARAYFTGHSHVYGRCLLSISNGPALRQLIVGTSGGPLDYTWDGQYHEPAGSGATIVPEFHSTPPDTYGYTLVRMSGNRVVMEYRSSSNLTAWTTNDVFAYTLAATPTNVNASHGDYIDKVLVAWNPSADASGYEVWRGTNATTTNRVLIGAGAGSPYSDSTAIPAVYYYYWVRATNTDGSSPYSDFDTGWRNTPGGLPAPAGVSATQGSYTNKVRVRWLPVANATAYDVYRSLANDHATAALVASGQTIEMYDDPGTLPLQNNFYWIKARNVWSTSGFSSSAAGYRGAGPYLPPPVSVSASDGLYPDRIAVAWAGVSAASEYEVWRSATNHAPLALRLAVLTATNYSDLSAGQFPGVSLYYWIKAGNTSATSDFSAPASGYCAPTGATASADIYLADFVFKPPRLRPRYHPGAVSSALGNNGPAALAAPNTRVCFDFYLSSDAELHDETDLWIGDYLADISLTPAGATRIILSSDARAGLHIPEMPAGLYNVFAHVRHAAPSTLVDPVPENNTAMRVGAILVDPAASSWCDGLNDLDGDGKTDFTVYQQAAGLWCAILSDNGFITATAAFGGAGYAPVSGDYDGDGKTDLTVYLPAEAALQALQTGQEATPSTGSALRQDSVQAGSLQAGSGEAGQWNALLSGNGYQLVTVPLGGPGNSAVSSDLDGDGKTDLTVYWEATGQWNAFLSGSGFILASATLGGAGYAPVPDDLDGDGKTDLTVYREATGQWNALLSGSGFTSVSATLGGAGYAPVSGDYDGDGKSDLMVYQEATGQWCALLSGSNFASFTAIFGGAGYLPVAGDYDGDGKTDLTVYQESTGLWTVALSGSGYAAVTIPLGGTGYIPLP